MAYISAAFVLFLALGCHAAAPTKLVGSGSTTVQKLFGDLAAAVNKLHHVQITYNSVGSIEGKRNFIQSTSEFVLSLVPFTPAEESQLSGDVKFTLPYAIEVITVFTSGIPGAPKLRFSPQVLAQIFQGKIIVWDHPAILHLNPGLKVPKLKRITVVRRKDVAGATQLFTAWLQKTVPSLWKLGTAGSITWPATFLAGRGSSGVAALLKAHPYSISYLDTGSGVAARLSESLLPNQAGLYLFASSADVYASVPKTLPAATGRWSGVSLLSRPGQQTWPITTFVYLFARQNQIQSGLSGALLVSWLDFLWSPSAQRVVSRYNLYPVPYSVRVQNLAAIKTVILPPAIKPPF